mgnify:CR=1 FL=1
MIIIFSSSGAASLNGTGYLEPGDQASISGDFELNVPFTIIVGDYIEPDTYTDINLIPANPTYLAPFDNSTKESIDNSLEQASMSSYIENKSVFVGSVSIIVSTDENYFPLNFNEKFSKGDPVAVKGVPIDFMNQIQLNISQINLV